VFFQRRSIAEVDAATAYAWQQSGEACIIDVREPFELEEAAISGAISLPMSQVGLDSYPDFGAKKVVVVCHSGVRSARVAAALAARGVPEVYNLRHGIVGWAGARLPLAETPDGPDA